MKFIGEDIPQSDAFPEGDAPFDVSEVLDVMRLLGGGDALCLDTGRKRRKGTFPAAYWRGPADLRKSGLDFWEEFNRHLRINDEPMADVRQP